MLETEQRPPIVETPPKEDIEIVAYCVSSYLSAFSKEPFDEKWFIDGERSPAFLLNPRTTGDFIKEMLAQEGLEIISLSDGSEQVRVSKEIVLNHIDRTLNDPMTEYLCSVTKDGESKEEPWISEYEILELEDLRNKIEKKDENFVDINIPYPLTSVLESYVSATKDPVSMVLLGYQEAPCGQKDPFGKENSIKFLRIQPGVEIPKDIYARFVCRYVTWEHPCFKNKQNVQDLVINEVGHYLRPGEIERVKNALDPNLYTTFFGELAKIPSSDKSIKAIPIAGTEYIKIITSMSEGDRKFDFLDLISHQLVYLSIKGTSVLEKSKQEKGHTMLFDGVMGLLKSLGLNYEEEMLKFKNAKNQEVVIGIIKRIEDSD